MAIAKVKATPIVEGKYAKDIIKEISRKPSKSAILRNKKAADLVKRLRG